MNVCQKIEKLIRGNVPEDYERYSLKDGAYKFKTDEFGTVTIKIEHGHVKEAILADGIEHHYQDDYIKIVQS